ncbi:hypothetical protein DRN86_00760 [Candidatus Geothermarchaeota archaeon]|nr:MAG: hypothetical protein DRN86_00760 [Candidatus Geothermarchaeota archaeon]
MSVDLMSLFLKSPRAVATFVHMTDQEEHLTKHVLNNLLSLLGIANIPLKFFLIEGIINLRGAIRTLAKPPICIRAQNIEMLREHTLKLNKKGPLNDFRTQMINLDL